MGERMGNSSSTWRMSINEKKFIESALLLFDIRVDGRRPFDYRRLTIKFGKEDGSSEVQLGQTLVMAFVTSQLTQPYRDRPNEGSLSIFTEFSPMADPSFEAGRPAESAVELGRIIDRGLRESRAVDTESLCVLAGKLVWAIRVDIHILDNGGNLVDAANVAALAALMTFRRPECTLGGEDGQEVILHPPEEKDPLPLTIHHLPIAVTFAFLGKDNIAVIDPSHNEEAIMRGRMTATLNMNGEVCAVQKAGGAAVIQSVIMQCFRIASVKAGDITSKIKDAVEIYNTERAQRKIKRHTSLVPKVVDVNVPDIKRKQQDHSTSHASSGDLLKHHTEEVKDVSDGSYGRVINGIEGETRRASKSKKGNTKKFSGAPSSWDPYTTGINSHFHRTSLSSPEGIATSEENEKMPEISNSEETSAAASVTIDRAGSQMSVAKTLKDAVKPKNKRKKKALSGI